LNKRIVISSDCRKLGRTLVAESLLKTLTELNLTAAYGKLSLEGHGPDGFISNPGEPGTDTHRCSVSGASRVFYYKYSSVDELDGMLSGLSFESDILILESNTILRILDPDLHIHISSEADKKISSNGLELKAELTLCCPVSSLDAGKITRLVPGLMGIGDTSPISIGGKHWLNINGEPLFGEGRMDLLKAVHETGSILQAARKTGIQYKRAWVMLHDAEDRLGAKLLSSGRGGTGGGGTSITNLAASLLAIWEKSEKDFTKLLEKLEV